MIYYLTEITLSKVRVGRRSCPLRGRMAPDSHLGGRLQTGETVRIIGTI